MRIRTTIIATIMALAASGCSDDSGLTEPTAEEEPPVPPAPAVLLKDVVIPNLPSPYYHFEYDTAGRMTMASFASEFAIYEVIYDRGRISALNNKTAGNRDKLEYLYDDAGRVAWIRYLDSKGLPYTTVSFSYEGRKLVGVERSRKLGSGFVVDKTMSFSYYSDDNVAEVMEFHPPIEGVQSETSTLDRYEDYDDKVNVDAFDLLHTEFFDHLVLLPGVTLQKGNPGRATHSGDGVRYEVDYTYTYDDHRRPLTKTGSLVFLDGANTVTRFQTLSRFSYY